MYSNFYIDFYVSQLTEKEYSRINFIFDPKYLYPLIWVGLGEYTPLMSIF